MEVSGLAESKQLFLAFVLFSPLKDWMIPTHFGKSRSSLLKLLIQMLISSKDTPGIMLYKLAGHPSLSPGTKTQQTILGNPGTLFLQGHTIGLEVSNTAADERKKSHVFYKTGLNSHLPIIVVSSLTKIFPKSLSGGLIFPTVSLFLKSWKSSLLLRIILENHSVPSCQGLLMKTLLQFQNRQSFFS